MRRERQWQLPALNLGDEIHFWSQGATSEVFMVRSGACLGPLIVTAISHGEIPERFACLKRQIAACHRTVRGVKSALSAWP